MIDQLAVDIVNALSEDPLAIKAGSSGLGAEKFGALLAGDPGTLFSETAVHIEEAAILDLADQPMTEASLVSGTIANVAAATIELSPEALAQAAAAGLPATLSDDTPAYPRSFEARRLNPNGGVLPVSGLDHWQAAIEMFKHNGPIASNHDLPAPVPRICPFCGKIHTIFVGEDSLSASEESCAAYAALLEQQNHSLE
jgi:hypothetical protein